VARWLHDLYPPDPAVTEAPGQDWIGSLRPGLIAERLAVGVLADRPDLIPALFTGLDARSATRALTMLAHAAAIEPDAMELLGSALAADVEGLVVPAISVTLASNPAVGGLIESTLSAQPPASEETLRRILAAIPESSDALAGTAVTVLRQLSARGADVNEQHAMRRVSEIRRCPNRAGMTAFPPGDRPAGDQSLWWPRCTTLGPAGSVKVRSWAVRAPVVAYRAGNAAGSSGGTRGAWPLPDPFLDGRGRRPP
jgi:hypothetical protein